MSYQNADDRPEPSEQPIRARVPDHVSRGAFSTGVILMTAQAELVLDFVQNLGRPHQIVARVIMPNHVLPQFIDALQRNIDLYRSRWGELPRVGMPPPAQLSWGEPAQQPAKPELGTESVNTLDVAAGASGAGQSAAPAGGSSGSAGSSAPVGSQPTGSAGGGDPPHDPPGSKPPSGDQPPQEPGKVRQASAQDIYDDLKIPDEMLSGAYANAVMIGHGPHEFSFDFITNFYPSSSVSSRVFLAAGQVPRLLDSLKGTWNQLRQRMNPRPNDPDEGSGPTA